MRCNVLSPAFFPLMHARRRARGAAREEALFSLWALALGPCGDFQANVARTYMREAEGYHLTASDDAPGWAIEFCDALRLDRRKYPDARANRPPCEVISFPAARVRAA